MEMMNILVEAGIPAGVANLVVGEADPIGQEMLRQPACAKIHLTGSLAVGKRLMDGASQTMKRLSLMSGGEKSLVALAFMFAVFLARPCPFYILDEVEAALDDANIDRFLQLIRRFSDRAQFVIVTHQKRTMDAADILYGVSMGGDGVSKVVSRKLGPDRPFEALIEEAAA